MRCSRSAILFSLLSISLFSACGGSKQEAKGTGQIVGKVEQVLYHGSFNRDEPNQTISPLPGVRLILADSTGKEIDTVLSGADGTFAIEAVEGVYLLISPERAKESIPGSPPHPERIVLRAGAKVALLLQYKIFAP